MTVNEVTRFPTVLPQKTIPVFKLLGSVDTFNFAYSEPTYATRRASWRHAFTSFADRVKIAPLICLGLENCGSVLIDVLAELLAERRTIVSPLVFVKAEFDAATLSALGDMATGRVKWPSLTVPFPMSSHDCEMLMSQDRHCHFNSDLR